MEISLDFETYCEEDITSGAWKYSEHPSCEILCLAFSFNNSPDIHVYKATEDVQSNEPLQLLFEHIKAQNCVLKAWNANFERAIWENVATKKLGFPPVPINLWSCDMAVAAYFARPLSLQRCGTVQELDFEYLKSLKGKALLRKFSVPRKPTKLNPSTRIKPIDDLENYEALVDYCKQDVVSQRAIVNSFARNKLDAFEMEAWKYDSLINSRGFLVDPEYCRGAVSLSEQYQEQQLQELVKVTDGRVDSVKKVLVFMKWLKEQGCYIENLQKGTIKEYLETQSEFSPDSKVIKALTIRQNLGLSSVAKYEAMLKSCDKNNRVKGTLQFLGATRTGRFSGRRVQIQNFPRGQELSKEQIEAIKEADLQKLEELSENTVIQTLSEGLRQAIVAPKGKTLGIVDYSSIENRLISWFAGDVDSLIKFQQGFDQYKDMATLIYNVSYEEVTKDQRFRCKPVVLGAGFGLSSQGLLRYAEAMGVRITESEAEHQINAYRSRYNKITKLWYELGKAAKNAIESQGTPYAVGSNKFGKVVYKLVGKDLFCKLPSGRLLCYPEASIVDGKITYKEEKGIHWLRTWTWGGKLVENICQAAARDLLVAALVELEKQNIPVAFHVHDEIVCELSTEEQIKKQEEIMVTAPKWASTLPLACEGFISERYRKD